jgi:tRNA-dihydrouridine synthase A
LLETDPRIFGEPAPVFTPAEAIEKLVPYVERELARGVRLSSIARHVLGIFHAVPGARAFRRQLATEVVKPGAGVDVLRAALAAVTRAPTEPARAAAELQTERPTSVQRHRGGPPRKGLPTGQAVG